MKQRFLCCIVFEVNTTFRKAENTLILTSSADKDPELVEEAVKYVIFLVDADKLFDVALGMYDFSLVLLIAQHSQRVHFTSYSFVIRFSTILPYFTLRIRGSICLS